MSLVFAAASAVFMHDGQLIRLNMDEAWLADDPVVRAHPDMFKDRPTHIRGTIDIIEQATAAPGERRRAK